MCFALVCQRRKFFPSLYCRRQSCNSRHWILFASPHHTADLRHRRIVPRSRRHSVGSTWIRRAPQMDRRVQQQQAAAARQETTGGQVPARDAWQTGKSRRPVCQTTPVRCGVCPHEPPGPSTPTPAIGLSTRNGDNPLVRSSKHVRSNQQIVRRSSCEYMLLTQPVVYLTA